MPFLHRLAAHAPRFRASMGLALLLALLPALVACGGSPDSSSGQRFVASPEARRYPLTGVVRAVHADDQTLSVAHEPIAGLMDAMTMDFHVQDPWVLQAAGPGDRISATLVLDGARSWIEGVVIAQGGDPLPGSRTALPGMPAVAVPDVPFINQDGAAVRPTAYQGHPVVYTFIYTRCPLPDYCPLMMQRLNEVAAALERQGRADDVWLVAVTLDPAYDTPDVLKAFGDRYIPAPTKGGRYDRRALLTGDPDAIRAFASTFQLTYEAEGDEIVHGLRTVVVDADGHIVQVFRGNDWSAADLLAALPHDAES